MIGVRWPMLLEQREAEVSGCEHDARRAAGILMHRASEAPPWLGRVWLDQAADALEGAGLTREADAIWTATDRAAPDWRALDRLQQDLLWNDAAEGGAQ